MNRQGDRVLVVGGGIIGLWSAYELAETGRSVTVVERKTVGSGSSGGNCGLVCPSHVLPLAEPGMVAEGIKAFFRKNSPLTIRPRLDPALWAWLYRFARRCNERDRLESARGIQPLLEVSLSLYQDAIAKDALDCEWETNGLLFPYRDREALDRFDETNRLLDESFHCPARKLIGEEARAFEPALRDGLAGAWYYEHDAHLRPDRLLRSLRDRLIERGVVFREGTTGRGFETVGSVAKALTTAEASLEADLFVIAAGAWTPKWNETIGARIPIQPGKGYSLTMPRPSICPKIPLIFPETRVAATPFRSGYRLGSTMEFAGYDETIDPKRLELLKEGARPFLREPWTEPIEERWYGWRPMTPDGLPVIDRSPRFKNVWIAAGHNMLGLSMAPATGRLIADLIDDRPATFDPSPYRIGRF